MARERRQLAAAVTLALAAGVTDAQTIELGSLAADEGFAIEGGADTPDLGRRVSGAGDFNGDGYADLIVRSERADVCVGTPVCVNKPRAGQAYIVFGGPSPLSYDPSDPENGGLPIYGAQANDFAGLSIAAAADVNGDGYSDVVVSAITSDYSGRVYVVFGHPTRQRVFLSQLDMPTPPSDLGFVIDGLGPDQLLGESVSGAGDFNGDGLDDVIVGAPYADRAYLVFGKTSTESVDVDFLGDSGFRILGENGTEAGHIVAGAGDVNGDGFDDVIVAVPSADSVGRATALVIFGRPDPSNIDLADIGEAGMRIANDQPLSGGRMSTAPAGDVNQDGYSDVLMGVPLQVSASLNTGAAFLITGSRDGEDVDIVGGEMAGRGVRFTGDGMVLATGEAVAGAGDFNGDGRSDVVIGAPRSFGDVGAGFVVYGEPSLDTVALESLSTQGVRLLGESAGDFSGQSLSGAGDINGDGMADVIVGAHEQSQGDAFVVFSPWDSAQSRTYRTFIADGDAPPKAVGSLGNGTNHGTPDARAWIDFDDGQGPGETSFVEVTTVNGRGGYPGDAVARHWHVTSNRTGWTQAEVSFKYVPSEQPLADETDFEVTYAPTPNGPFRRLPTKVDPFRNRVVTSTEELGYFFIAPTAADLIFRNSFDAQE